MTEIEARLGGVEAGTVSRHASGERIAFRYADARLVHEGRFAAFDLNPVPADVRPRVLSTGVTPDAATGSLDAARESASYFGLAPKLADAIIGEVLRALLPWARIARGAGASAKECDRMESAFLSGRQ